MKLHDIRPADGSRKERKRVGRGTSSGTGKTAGRGHKGQKARSGGGVRPGFEGGQNPIYRRLPKRGFTNISRKEYAIVKVEDLNRFDEGMVITPEVLMESGLIKKVMDGVKVLGNGELEVSRLTVKSHKFTASAKDKIEALGGTAEVI